MYRIMKINLNKGNSNSELKDHILLMLGVPAYEVEPSVEDEIDYLIESYVYHYGDHWSYQEKADFLYQKMIEQIYIDGNVIALK